MGKINFYYLCREIKTQFWGETGHHHEHIFLVLGHNLLSRYTSLLGRKYKTEL